MMFHIAALNSSGMGYYGTSLGVAPRRDIGAAYGRLMAEIGEFAEDATNLFWKIASRRGKKKACIAMARKILVISYNILKNKQPYIEGGPKTVIQAG